MTVDTEEVRTAIEEAMHWIGGAAVMVPGSRKHSRALAGALLTYLAENDRLLARLRDLEDKRGEAESDAGDDGWDADVSRHNAEFIVALANRFFARAGSSGGTTTTGHPSSPDSKPAVGGSA